MTRMIDRSIVGMERQAAAEYANMHPGEFQRFIESIFSTDSGNDLKQKLIDLIDMLVPRLASRTIECALNDANLNVRVQGLQAAYRVRTETLNERLISILTNQNEPFAVRKWATHILASTDPIRYGRVLRQICRDISECIEIRRETIFALTGMDDDQTIGLLCALLGDADVEIRRAAAWSLGKISMPTSVNCLLAALEDADECVRDWAVRALRDMDDARALQGLASAVKMAPPNEQVRLIRLLADSQAEPILRSIAETLHSSNVNVRREAAWAMGVTRYAPAVPSLRMLLDDEDMSVREYAEKALMRIGDVDPRDLGLIL